MADWATLLQGNVKRQREGAERIESEEYRRYGEGLGVAQDAYKQSSEVLNQGIDADLLFSRAADTAGARSRGLVESLRSSLGARGLSPNSGAAQGLLSRIAMSQQGELIGAKRDIAIENQRQRQVNAAVNFANALNLASYTNSPVPGARLETDQNIFEGLLGMYGVNRMSEAQSKAGKQNILGSLIGGGTSILGSLIGG